MSYMIYKKKQIFEPLKHKFNSMNICIYCGVEILIKTIDNKTYTFYRKFNEKNYSLDKPYCA